MVRVSVMRTGISVECCSECLLHLDVRYITLKRHLLKKTFKAVAMAAAVAAASVSVPAAANPWSAGLYPDCPEVNLADMIDELVDNGPEWDDEVDRWQDSTGFNEQKFSFGFTYVVNNGPITARNALMEAGLDVCQAKSVAGANSPFNTVVIYDPDGFSPATSTGVPVLVYRSQVRDEVWSSSRVILSIPHAKTESYLADYLSVEAINVAEDENGLAAVRAAVISTVHRCHSDIVMDEDAPYWGEVNLDECNDQMRLSDDAHNADSLFQRMHYWVGAFFPHDQVVQIHGAGSNFGGISVSNGSGDNYTGTVTQDTDHAVVRAYDELTLMAGSPANAEFTICHDYTAIPGRTRPTGYFQIEDRRCGTHNATRGEAWNFQSDMDSHYPGIRKFHFIHMEVDSDLKNTPAERAVIIGALGRIVEND